jgi:hypothetical protein
MQLLEPPDKVLPLHEIGSGQVTSEAERVLLQEVFVWLLDQAHLPSTQKESDNALRRAKKKRQRQELRICKAIFGRVQELVRQFPENQTWIVISESISARIIELSEQMQWVAYTANDGYSWYMRRGVMPAIGPRLLLALCIAQELWPERSPYRVVVEQMGLAGDPNPDIVDNSIRAIKKRALDVLKSPEKYPVAGGPRTTDPWVLLRHELLDFKLWKETQQEPPDQSIEEFEAQFSEYMNRIHPTADEEHLLRKLLDKFVEGIQTRSRKQNLENELSYRKIQTSLTP